MIAMLYRIRESLVELKATVLPAQAGTQRLGFLILKSLDSRLRGNDKVNEEFLKSNAGIINLHTLLAVLFFLFASTCNAQTTSSAAPTTPASVQILPPMAIPGLNRERIVRVYLPPSYRSSEKRYPVLYMHDGQNLFDAATAFAGEWNIDEAMDSLAKSDQLEVIVVGIDNGQEKRMNELSPWTNRRYGNGEGKQYLGFLVDTVKPYIDQHYRTLSDRNNTAIMGSSMGGLISHYAIHQYPALFSKAGIFSPSYWYSKDVYKHTRDNVAPASARLYVMVGSKEGKEAADKMHKMAKQLRKQQHPEANLHIEVVQGGEHNEAFWRNEFPKAMRWLFKTQ